MESDPRAWIDALRTSHEQISALVSPLDGAALRSPAYPTEWSIAQVLSHFGSGCAMFELLLTAGLTGGPVPGVEQMQPIWNAWNAKSPEDQVGDGLAADDALISRLESLSSADVERFHLSAFGMELDLVGFCRLRLSEHALHTWDVAVALDPTASLNPQATALLIDGQDRMAARAKNLDGTPLRLAVTTTEPSRSFLLETGETTSLTPGPAKSSDAQLAIPAEALMRLFAGRLDPEHTPAVTIRRTDLDRLRQMYPGI